MDNCEFYLIALRSIRIATKEISTFMRTEKSIYKMYSSYLRGGEMVHIQILGYYPEISRFLNIFFKNLSVSIYSKLGPSNVSSINVFKILVDNNF